MSFHEKAALPRSSVLSVSDNNEIFIATAARFDKAVLAPVVDEVEAGGLEMVALTTEATIKKLKKAEPIILKMFRLSIEMY